MSSRTYGGSEAWTRISPTLTGWQCPVCLRVWSPYIALCQCSGTVTVAGVTTSMTTHWPTCPRCHKEMNQPPGPECGAVHCPSDDDYAAARAAIAEERKRDV